MKRRDKYRDFVKEEGLNFLGTIKFYNPKVDPENVTKPTQEVSKFPSQDKDKESHHKTAEEEVKQKREHLFIYDLDNDQNPARQRTSHWEEMLREQVLQINRTYFTMPNSMNPISVHTFKPYIQKDKTKKSRKQNADEYP